MASTAQERLLEIDKLDGTLLNKKIKFSNGEYKSVKDYLIEVYPDELDFDAGKILTILQSRVNKAEMDYKQLLNEVFEKALNDPKYSQPIRKGENEYMSFREYIESLPVGTIISYDDSAEEVEPSGESVGE
jgi:hypothetical protein